MDIDSSLRDAMVVDRGGYPYIIHPLMDGVPRVDPALLTAFADWVAEQPGIKDATVLLTPEAMGVPLAAAVSMRTGIPYLVIRKRRYELPGETIAYCETGYSQSSLYINGLEATDRIALIDDVISTGGTLDGLLAALKAMGQEVLGVFAFVDKGTKRAEELSERHGIPVHAMRSVTVTHQRVEVSQ